MEKLKDPLSCNSIDDIRNQIDKIDNELIRLFSLRNNFVKEIVSYKSTEEGVIAESRKNLVIKERTQQAKKQGLNPNVFKQIFTLLIEDNIKKELELFNIMPGQQAK